MPAEEKFAATPLPPSTGPVEWSKFYSDRPLLTTPLSSVDDKYNKNIMTWSITPRVGAGEISPKQVEDIDNYVARLKRIAEKLADEMLSQKNNLAIISLQDVPKDPDTKKVFTDALKNKLRSSGQEQDWDVETFFLAPDQQASGVLTIINKTLVTAERVAGATETTLHKDLLTTDLVFKEKPAENKGVKIRLVNARFRQTATTIKSDLTNLKMDYDGQLVVAGDFAENLTDLGESEKCLTFNKGRTGFYFKEDPATYNLTQKKVNLPANPPVTINPTEKFISNIKWGDLISWFSNQNSDVEKISDSQARIKRKASDEYVDIQRSTNDHISFKANKGTDDNIKNMVEAAKKILPGSTVKIEVTGDQKSPAVISVGDKTWLAAIKAGLKVSGYEPSQAFLEVNKNDEAVTKYLQSQSSAPPTSSPSPSRS